MAEFPKGIKIKTCDLTLGDVVSTFDGPYSRSTVVNIVKGEVKLFRPFVHVSEYRHSGGVTPYIGIENYGVPANSLEVTLWYRRDEAFK